MYPSLEIAAIPGPRDFYAPIANSLAWDEIGHGVLWDSFQVYGAFTSNEAERKFVGMSALTLFTPEETIIARLAVVPEHRNRGIGSLLIEHAIDIARKQGCSTVSIQPTNRRNAELYKVRGFHLDRSRDLYRYFRELSKA
jgi:GNAT superfamily N-acetyltransferase